MKKRTARGFELQKQRRESHPSRYVVTRLIDMAAKWLKDCKTRIKLIDMIVMEQSIRKNKSLA